MSDATCKTCPWFDYSPDGSWGLCRSKPPCYDEKASKAMWPMVTDRDWCGEHPDRQPRLDSYIDFATTTSVTRETLPTAADMRRIVDALEKMASHGHAARS